MILCRPTLFPNQKNLKVDKSREARYASHDYVCMFVHIWACLSVCMTGYVLRGWICVQMEYACMCILWEGECMCVNNFIVNLLYYFHETFI